MGMFVGIAVLIIFAIFALGWLVPLVLGICMRKQGARGVILMVVGVVWGVGALGFTGFVGVVAWAVQRQASTHHRAVAFDAASHTGGTAVVTMDFEGTASMRLRMDEGGLVSVEGADSAFTVPAEPFKVQHYSLTMVHGDASWTASGNPRGVNLDLGPDETVAASFGPPFTAEITHRRVSGEREKLSLVLKDETGASVSIKGPGRSAKHEFEVLAEDDTVVWKGTFEYG